MSAETGLSEKITKELQNQLLKDRIWRRHFQETSVSLVLLVSKNSNLFNLDRKEVNHCWSFNLRIIAINSQPICIRKVSVKKDILQVSRRDGRRHVTVETTGRHADGQRPENPGAHGQTDAVWGEMDSRDHDLFCESPRTLCFGAWFPSLHQNDVKTLKKWMADVDVFLNEEWPALGDSEALEKQLEQCTVRKVKLWAALSKVFTLKMKRKCSQDENKDS